MLRSIFAIELCMKHDPGLRASLHRRIAEHPRAAGYQEKWALYRDAVGDTLAWIDHVERGCWDYFDDDARAQRDYKMWCDGMTTEEGVRKVPSPNDPYRVEPRYMTLTMAFLIVQGSPTDRALAQLCDIPDGDLWRRSTFARILGGMGCINFASVLSDVIYLIPGDDAWGLTTEDLSETKFEYLRPVV